MRRKKDRPFTQKHAELRPRSGACTTFAQHWARSAGADSRPSRTRPAQVYCLKKIAMAADREGNGCALMEAKVRPAGPPLARAPGVACPLPAWAL